MADKKPYKHRAVRINDDGSISDIDSNMDVLCPWCDRTCNICCAAYRAKKDAANILCNAGPKGLIIGTIEVDPKAPDDEAEIEGEEE